MALSETTLASALGAGDASATVASATSLAAGSIFLVDLEQCKVTKAYVVGSTTVPLLRGQGGTAQIAHPVTARVTHGTASDFADPAVGSPGVNFPVAGRSRDCVSYSAAGAIALPSPGSDRLVILNSTAALAMTLANPTKDMDGVFLWIVGNGSAAHTVTPATAFNDAGSNVDLATFAAGGRAVFLLIAVNEIWCTPSFLAGTLTNITLTMS